MARLGAQPLRQVKSIDKNNFIEYIEPRFKNAKIRPQCGGLRFSPTFKSAKKLSGLLTS